MLQVDMTRRTSAFTTEVIINVVETLYSILTFFFFINNTGDIKEFIKLNNNDALMDEVFKVAKASPYGFIGFVMKNKIAQTTRNTHIFISFICKFKNEHLWK